LKDGLHSYEILVIWPKEIMWNYLATNVVALHILSCNYGFTYWVQNNHMIVDFNITSNLSKWCKYCFVIYVLKYWNGGNLTISVVSNVICLQLHYEFFWWFYSIKWICNYYFTTINVPIYMIPYNNCQQYNVM
jgi:hypothetical protein